MSRAEPEVPFSVWVPLRLKCVGLVSILILASVVALLGVALLYDWAFG